MDGIRSGKYICNVLGGDAATVAHDTYDEAKAEALRLCKSTNKTVIVAKVACICQNEPKVTEAVVHMRDCMQDIQYPKYAMHIPSQTYGMVVGVNKTPMGKPEYLFVKGFNRHGVFIAYYNGVMQCPMHEIVIFSGDDNKNIAACKQALREKK